MLFTSNWNKKKSINKIQNQPIHKRNTQWALGDNIILPFQIPFQIKYTSSLASVFRSHHYNESKKKNSFIVHIIINNADNHLIMDAIYKNSIKSVILQNFNWIFQYI